MKAKVDKELQGSSNLSLLHEWTHFTRLVHGTFFSSELRFTLSFGRSYGVTA